MEVIGAHMREAGHLFGAEVAGVVFVNVGNDLVDLFGGGVGKTGGGIAVAGDGARGAVVDHELQYFKQPDQTLHG